MRRISGKKGQKRKSFQVTRRRCRLKKTSPPNDSSKGERTNGGLGELVPGQRRKSGCFRFIMHIKTKKGGDRPGG